MISFSLKWQKHIRVHFSFTFMILISVITQWNIQDYYIYKNLYHKLWCKSHNYKFVYKNKRLSLFKLIYKNTTHWLLYNNDSSTNALQTTRWFPWRQQGRGHLFTQKFSRLFWARSNTADAMEHEAAERHDITDSRSSRQRGGTDFKSLTTDVKLRLFFT